MPSIQGTTGHLTYNALWCQIAAMFHCPFGNIADKTSTKESLATKSG